MASVSREVLCATKGPLNATNKSAVDVENSLKKNFENAEKAISSHTKREKAIDQQLHLFTHLLDKLAHWRQTLVQKQNPAASAPLPRPINEKYTANFVSPVSAARDRELSSVSKALATIEQAKARVEDLRGQLTMLQVKVRGEIYSMQCIITRDSNAFSLSVGAGRTIATPKGDSRKTGTPSEMHITGAYLPFLNGTTASTTSNAPRASTPRENHSAHSVSEWSVHWERSVADTYAETFRVLRECVELQNTIELECRCIAAECALQHCVAVNAFNVATDARLSARNSIIADIRNIEQRVVELRKEWKRISDAAIAMKDPLHTAAARYTIRDGVENQHDDAVNRKIEHQQDVTQAARKEVKKRCRYFHDEVQILEAEYIRKQSALREFEAMVPTMSSKGPAQPNQHALTFGVSQTQKHDKQQSIRTYPEHTSLASPFATTAAEVTKVRARSFWPVLTVSEKQATKTSHVPAPPPPRSS